MVFLRSSFPLDMFCRFSRLFHLQFGYFATEHFTACAESPFLYLFPWSLVLRQTRAVCLIGAFSLLPFWFISLFISVLW